MEILITLAGSIAIQYRMASVLLLFDLLWFPVKLHLSSLKIRAVVCGCQFKERKRTVKPNFTVGMGEVVGKRKQVLNGHYCYTERRRNKQKASMCPYKSTVVLYKNN